MPTPRLDLLAEEILARLALRPEAGEIVLGGYFALQRHLDYRTTHDLDAWWRRRATPEAEAAIRAVMAEVAQSRGLALRERAFGETRSYELIAEGKKAFSFQIATRTVELDEPLPSPWGAIRIESLRDNIGSKMNALVDRGAARDFLDIRRVVEAGLASTWDCWQWWQLKNASESLDEAKQKVGLHLSGLEARRPLADIADGPERQAAQATREWFRTTFLAR